MMPDRPLRTVGMLGLAATTAMTGATALLGDVQPAEAYCSGGSTYVAEHYVYYGGLILTGREAAQNSGTCDGDYYYAGKVEDSVSDGACVSVWIDDYPYYAAQATECTTYSWKNYTYSDGYGVNQSYLDPAPEYVTPYQLASNSSY